MQGQAVERGGKAPSSGQWVNGGCTGIRVRSCFCLCLVPLCLVPCVALWVG